MCIDNKNPASEEVDVAIYPVHFENISAEEDICEHVTLQFFTECHILTAGVTGQAIVKMSNMQASWILTSVSPRIIFFTQ